MRRQDGGAEEGKAVEMRRTSEEAKTADEETLAILEKMDNLNKYIEKIKKQIEESDKLGKKLSMKVKINIGEVISDVGEWLEDNKRANVEEIERKIKYMMDVMEAIANATRLN
jgi:molecular chaperone DnaK (HSP70)